MGVVLDFCRHYCFSWRIFYLTKLFAAVNPLVYGFRIPKYRMLFLKFLDIKYTPGHDSIELDSRALRNSPANVGILVMFQLILISRTNKHHHVSKLAVSGARVFSSLPCISAANDIIPGRKSQDMISTSTPSYMLVGHKHKKKKIS